MIEIEDYLLALKTRGKRLSPFPSSTYKLPM